MRRLLDTLAAVLLTAFVINLLFEMLRPYAVFFAIALIVVAIGSIVKRQRYW